MSEPMDVETENVRRDLTHIAADYLLTSVHARHVDAARAAIALIDSLLARVKVLEEALRSYVAAYEHEEFTKSADAVDSPRLPAPLEGTVRQERSPR